MGRFKSTKLMVAEDSEGVYPIELPDETHGEMVNVNGRWRSRPIGGRLFTETEIHQIRAAHGSLKDLAFTWGCSAVSIRSIKKRAIYCDVPELIQ